MSIPGDHVFAVKDSGARQQYDSGMVRDVEEGKTDYSNVLHGPMFDRWAEHLTKAKAKYPDVAPGVPNWTLAEGPAELARYRRSAFRHLVKWLKGEVDEDHAAAVFFNINGAEYVKDRLSVSRVWINGVEITGAVADGILDSILETEKGDVVTEGNPDEWADVDVWGGEEAYVLNGPDVVYVEDRYGQNARESAKDEGFWNAVSRSLRDR